MSIFTRTTTPLFRGLSVTNQMVGGDRANKTSSRNLRPCMPPAVPTNSLQFMQLEPGGWRKSRAARCSSHGWAAFPLTSCELERDLG